MSVKESGSPVAAALEAVTEEVVRRHSSDVHVVHAQRSDIQVGIHGT